MPNVQVLNMSGQKVGEMSLNDNVFGVKPNKTVMHEMVVNYLANQRQGTQSALTRAEVSGGGKKPWRQKGTGHARQGSIRSPQWRHGGVVFAPKPRDYGFDVNKKERRLAMKSALSSKVLDSNMIVLDKIAVDDFKTKTVVEMLRAIGAGKKVLLVLPEKDEKVINSARNIEGVKTAGVNTLNVYDILNCTSLVVAQEAVNKIEEVYA